MPPVRRQWMSVRAGHPIHDVAKTSLVVRHLEEPPLFFEHSDPLFMGLSLSPSILATLPSFTCTTNPAPYGAKTCHTLYRKPLFVVFGHVRSVRCCLSVYHGGLVGQTVQIGEAETIPCSIIFTCAFRTFTYNLINSSITKIMKMTPLGHRLRTLEYEITEARPAL